MNTKGKSKSQCHDHVRVDMKSQFDKMMNGPGCKVPWVNVNWDDQDIAIARQYGCSRERVRQKRKSLGVGRSPLWHSRQGCSKERLLKLGDTSGMTLKEISEVVGCSKSYVLQCLKATGGTYKAFINRGRTMYDWSKADWTKGYREIAKDLGIDNPNVVSQYRQRHGIKSARDTAADKIVTLLKKGKVLTSSEVADAVGCSERYAKSVLKSVNV